jgi:hypothetical protein
MTKQRIQVIKATTRKLPDISLDGKKMAFGDRAGAFEVSDPGLAREIDAAYGPKGRDMPGQVVVCPLNGTRGREAGHRYTFSVPELPWKKKSPVESGNQSIDPSATAGGKEE